MTERLQPDRIIVLSGHVCAGKSTVAALLKERFGAVHVRTSDCIMVKRPNTPRERKALQKAGEALDKATGGAWVLDAFREFLYGVGERRPFLIVVDSARIPGQVEAIRRGYGSRVIHIHLEASRETLAARYENRHASSIAELDSYAQVLANKTEKGVGDLAADADVVISTERCTIEDVVLRSAAQAGLFGREYDRSVDVIVGGQFGSEGKGQIAAHLAPEYDLLVRVGGPNAGHTVWQDPRPFTFRHLPSGTMRNPSAGLVIAAGAVVHLPTLLREIAECEVEADRLAIDPQTMVVVDHDIEQERVLRDTMGSTAHGVGSATARRIMERFKSRADCTIAENIDALRPFVRSTLGVLDRHFTQRRRVMLEGTQGTGLSLYHGEYPYVTSRDTTVAGCLAEAGISPSRVRKVVMVCRTYPIRVQSPNNGTSGFMPLEISWEEIARRSGLPLNELKCTERTSTTNRERRVSEFNWACLRRAASLNAPTDIALTFADYLDSRNRHAQRMDQLSPSTIRFIEEIERVAAAPVSLISVRFHSRAIVDRRRW